MFDRLDASRADVGAQETVDGVDVSRRSEDFGERRGLEEEHQRVEVAERVADLVLVDQLDDATERRELLGERRAALRPERITGELIPVRPPPERVEDRLGVPQNQPAGSRTVRRFAARGDLGRTHRRVPFEYQIEAVVDDGKSRASPTRSLAAASSSTVTETGTASSTEAGSHGRTGNSRTSLGAEATVTLDPFRIDIHDERLALLDERLRTTVWADEATRGEGDDDWHYGVSGAYLRELVAYWIDEYDWRAHESAMNRWPHVRGEIDGVMVHALQSAARARRHSPSCSRTDGRGRSGTSPK